MKNRQPLPLHKVLEYQRRQRKAKGSGDWHQGAASLRRFITLGTPHTLELTFRIAAGATHALAQRRRQRTAVDPPELTDSHLPGIHLASRTHGREKLSASLLGGTAQYKFQLVLQAVNGINNVVER